MPDVDSSSPRDARTGVLVHVDRSGYVCHAKVFDSCGYAKVDRNVVDAVSQWRFVPANKAGAPVETRTTMYVSVNAR